LIINGYLKYNYTGMLYSIQLNSRANFDEYLESDFYIIDDFDSFLIPSESNEPKNTLLSPIYSLIFFNILTALA
jgi:hypothetical protein